MLKPKYIIGIDEAGRGPLAGPVALASCFFNLEASVEILREFFPQGIRDSKKLTSKMRKKIFKKMQLKMKAGKLFFKVCFSSHCEINKNGIAFAVKKALVESIKPFFKKAKSCLVLLDGGLHAPVLFKNQKTIIKGDEKKLPIALASIAAKVSRDKKMEILAKRYPQYDFDIHKGYGTAKHLEKIKKHGLSPIHRKTFCRRFV